jgi:hypothetical protein
LGLNQVFLLSQVEWGMPHLGKRHEKVLENICGWDIFDGSRCWARSAWAVDFVANTAAIDVVRFSKRPNRYGKHRV